MAAQPRAAAPGDYSQHHRAATLFFANKNDDGVGEMLSRRRKRKITIRRGTVGDFTVNKVRENEFHARGTIHYRIANQELDPYMQCIGCHLSQGPFSTCTRSADLYRGACSNCLYENRAHMCSKATPDPVHLPVRPVPPGLERFERLWEAVDGLRAHYEDLIERLNRVEAELETAIGEENAERGRDIGGNGGDRAAQA